MQGLTVVFTVLFLCVGLSESTTSSIEEANGADASSWGCFACKEVMEQVYDFISSNSTPTEIFNVLDKVCKVLPGKLKNSCEKLSEKLVGIIPKLSWALHFQDITPEAVCGLAKYCDINCCISNAPEQVHLAAAQDPSQMIVSWTTQKQCDSIVQWGTSPQALTNSVNGAGHTYYSGGWVGWLHNTSISGLNPNTKYYYRVGSQASGWSSVFNFQTYDRESWFSDWAVIGDMGADPQAQNTIARLTMLAQSGGLNGVIHVGDISYADGIQHRWDMFMRMIESIAAYVPYMVVPGNHEIAIVSYLHLEGYINRFTMPVAYQSNSDFQQNYFWSWDYGLAHVVGIDSEHELDIPYISPNQFKWLENDLKVANQNRAQRPWLIAMLHRPMYCSSSQRECGIYASELRLILEDLFVKYKVDFVMHGHIHNYERTTPVYRNIPYPSLDNPTYPVYVINGAGGNRENPAGFSSTPGPWSVTRVKDWGYGRLSLNATALRWRFYTSSDNVLRDDLTITKTRFA